MIRFELFSCGAADDVLLEGFDRWSHSDTYMNGVVNRIVSNYLLIRLVAGFITQHVNSTIKEYCLTQPYAESGEVSEKEVQMDLELNRKVQKYAQARNIQESKK